MLLQFDCNKVNGKDAPRRTSVAGKEVARPALVKASPVLAVFANSARILRIER